MSAHLNKENKRPDNRMSGLYVSAQAILPPLLGIRRITV